MNIWIISTRNLSARVSKSVAVTARRLRATTSLDLSSTGASWVTLDRVSGISWLALARIETPLLAAYIYRLQWPSLPRPHKERQRRCRWQDYSTQTRGIYICRQAIGGRTYYSVIKHCWNQIIISLLFWSFKSPAISYCLVFSLTSAW